MEAAEFKDFMEDAKLHIKTTGRIETYWDDHTYPYEPTSYCVLDRLLESGLIRPEDHLLDYGCGKGRTLVYLHHKTGCLCEGVEMVKEFCDAATENIASYRKHKRGAGNDEYRLFVRQAEAQKYQIYPTVNRIFFFNPFSVEIFNSVMGKVMDSYYENMRRILLFLYYPEDAYIGALTCMEEVMFYDEIDCRDLFEQKDRRNRIMIFEIPANTI